MGCNSGYFSRELARRGCRHVTACDTDAHALLQAQCVREASGIEYDVLKLSVYDVCTLGGPFQLVLCLGLLYHLRYPLLALDRLREILEGRMVLICNLAGPDYPEGTIPSCMSLEQLPVYASEPGFPGCLFIEHSLAYGDATNWWIPNPAGLRAMLRSSGFHIIHHSSGLVVCE